MRLKKAEIVAIVVTLLFVALTFGFRWGRRSAPAQFSVRTDPTANGTLVTDAPGGIDRASP